MEGYYYCFVAAACKLGRMLVIVLLLILASVEPQGVVGVRDSIGIRRQLYVQVHGGGIGASEVRFTGFPAKKIKSDEPDMNYSNEKRRVPNGSDPIHNRRAGKSGEPPAV